MLEVVWERRVLLFVDLVDVELALAVTCKVILVFNEVNPLQILIKLLNLVHIHIVLLHQLLINLHQRTQHPILRLRMFQVSLYLRYTLRGTCLLILSTNPSSGRLRRHPLLSLGISECPMLSPSHPPSVHQVPLDELIAILRLVLREQLIVRLLVAQSFRTLLGTPLSLSSQGARIQSRLLLQLLFLELLILTLADGHSSHCVHFGASSREEEPLVVGQDLVTLSEAKELRRLQVLNEARRFQLLAIRCYLLKLRIILTAIFVFPIVAPRRVVALLARIPRLL